MPPHHGEAEIKAAFENKAGLCNPDSSLVVRKLVCASRIENLMKLTDKVNEKKKALRKMQFDQIKKNRSQSSAGLEEYNRSSKDIENQILRMQSRDISKTDLSKVKIFPQLKAQFGSSI